MTLETCGVGERNPNGGVHLNEYALLFIEG